MKIRIAGIVKESIVDGTGIRFSVFTQGCPHKCKGCHNVHTHDFSGGYEVDINELVEQVRVNPLLNGITITGGEPFRQAAACCELAKRVKELDKNVWCYSGYTIEELSELAKTDNDIKNLLGNCDVLVDGKFDESQADLTLKFKGSKNQRIIDLNTNTVY